MKHLNLIPILLLFSFLNANGQENESYPVCIPIDSTTNKYTYKIVEYVAETTDTVLYENLKYFVSSNFNNGEFSIDSPFNEILIKAIVQSSYTTKVGKKDIITPCPVNVDLRINFKNGKYRVTITNLTISFAGVQYPLEDYFSNLQNIISIQLSKKKTDELINRMSKSINDSMMALLEQIKNNAKQKEDW